MAEESSLDRLARCMNEENTEEYTLEEQMAATSTDEFLEGMSPDAKNNMSHFIEEVKLEESGSNMDEIPEDTEPQIETIPLPVEPRPVDQIMASTPQIQVSFDDDSENTANEELFNNNVEKTGRGRKKRNTNEVAETPASAQSTEQVSSNPIFDQLAKDVIDELSKQRFKIARFDDKSMKMLFNYMYSKF